MFEKYGIMDFLCGIKKAGLILLGIFLFCFVVGASKDYLLNEEEPAVDMRPTYSDTQIFYFTYKDLDMATEKGTDFIKMINAGINIYMRSAFADKYVLDYIEDKYGEDYLYEQLHIDDETLTPHSYSAAYLNTFTSCKILGDDLSINFVVSSRNKELTDILFEGFMSFLDDLEKNIYKDFKLIRFETYEARNIVTAKAESKIFDFKAGILFGAAAVVIGLIVIFFYTLFVPRMNRKADFVNYDVTVLGEIHEKNRKKDMVVQQYLRIVNQLEDSRVITLTSSMQNEKYSRQIYDKIKETFKENFEFLEYDVNELDYKKWIGANLKEDKNYFILLPSVVLYETALQVAKNSDAMVLTEKYGITSYKDFERVIELVNSSNIQLKGIIGLK